MWRSCMSLSHMTWIFNTEISTCISTYTTCNIQHITQHHINRYTSLSTILLYITQHDTAYIIYTTYGHITYNTQHTNAPSRQLDIPSYHTQRETFRMIFDTPYIIPHITCNIKHTTYACTREATCSRTWTAGLFPPSHLSPPTHPPLTNPHNSPPRLVAFYRRVQGIARGRKVSRKLETFENGCSPFFETLSFDLLTMTFEKFDMLNNLKLQNVEKCGDVVEDFWTLEIGTLEFVRILDT